MSLKLGLIGCGARGVSHLLSLQGSRFVDVVAVADLYDGHLQRAKEIAADGQPSGGQLATTRDYRSLLDRADLAAVIVAVPDFWQQTIFTAAVEAGKHVYCEAPFGRDLASSQAMAAAAKKAGVMVQVGSGVPTSVVCQKARQIVARGALGTVYLVDVVHHVDTSLDSWRLPYPPDASPESIDWEAYQQPAGRKHPFDLSRFFNWRCYWDYASGIAADALIDPLTAVQWIMGGGVPQLLSVSGGNYRWKDGRETPDVFQADFAYPKFALHISCAMTTATYRESVTIFGSDATLVLKASRGSGFDSLQVLTGSQMEPYAGAVASWPAEWRQRYYVVHGLDAEGRPMPEPPAAEAEQAWSDPAERASAGSNSPSDSLLGRHLSVFLQAALGRRQVNEPPELAVQAAQLAHLADDAYRNCGDKCRSSRQL